MEKNEFKALVERYKNEMIELFNLKKGDLQEESEHIVENINDENNAEKMENDEAVNIDVLEAKENTNEDQDSNQSVSTNESEA